MSSSPGRSGSCGRLERDRRPDAEPGWVDPDARRSPAACLAAHDLTVIRIIRDHNRLNGLRFCAFEFGAIALLCVGFAALFASRGSLLFGLVGLGIALNCLPVIVLAIRSIRAGERDIGLRAMLRSDVRAQAQHDVPTMQRDTLILSGATILPFVGLVAALIDWRRR